MITNRLDSNKSFVVIEKFTGGSRKLLSTKGAIAPAVRLYTLRANELNDRDLLLHLEDRVSSMKDYHIALVTECNPQLAEELSTWSTKRRVLHHYCLNNHTFAITTSSNEQTLPSAGGSKM